MSTRLRRAPKRSKISSIIFYTLVEAMHGGMLRCTLSLALFSVVQQAQAVNVPVGDEPIAVAINPTTHQAMVVGEDSHNLRIIDLVSHDVLGIIPLGFRSTDIAVNPVTNTAIVTHEKNDKASIIDLSTKSIVAILDVGREPEGIAVDPSLDVAVIANEKDDSVTIIDFDDHSTIATVPVGHRPEHVAVNVQTGMAVVSNEKDDTLSLVDLQTHLLRGTISVPEKPGDIAINPNTNSAIVTHEKINKISIINLSLGSVAGTLGVGRSPVSVAVNPETNRAAVVSRKEDSLTLVDLATYATVGKLRVGRDPADAAVEALNNVVAVVNEKSSSVSIIDLDNATFGTPAPAGRDPRGVAIHSGHHLGVVANEKSNSVTVIRLPSGSTIATVPVGRSPYDVTVDPQRGFAAVTLKKQDSVAFVDLAGLRLLGTINVGRDPQGIAADSQSGIAVVTNSGSDSLSVIDMDARAVTATIPTGREPRGVALQMPEGRAWVTLEREDAVQVIDLASHAIVATMPVGNNPAGIAISQTWRLAAVANEKDNSLTLVNLDTMAIMAVVAVGRDPCGVAIDDLAGRVYVANRRSNTVSVVNLDTHAVIDTLPTGRHPEQVAVDGVNLVGVVTNEGSDDVTVLTLPDTISPQINVDFPPDGQLTNQAQLTVSGTISEPATLTINTQPVALSQNYSFSHTVALQEGTNILTLEAKDNAGNTSSVHIMVVLDSAPPPVPDLDLISIGDVAGGVSTITGAPGSVEAGALVTVTNIRTQTAVSVTAGEDGRFLAQIAALPGDGVEITATDSAGNSGDLAKIFVGGLPPDPATLAPTLDPTVATNMYDATEFIYSGANPIQTGVAPGVIEKKRVAVLRGMVMDRDGTPISGVTITVHHHPEYGRTMTRIDGMFDMTVNGGGVYVVDYRKEGYFSVQRRIDAPWQEYALLPDVVLNTVDTAVTTIDLSSGSAMQVTQASVVTDGDGTRQATLMFAQGTQAEMVLPDESVQSLETLNVRATEYTVGDKGVESMPAELPPTTGYTYAVEFSVDEALAVNAKDVRFSQPVSVYINNFLGFPVGSIVPAGYYSREKATWVPSANGRVVEILGVSNGLADIDANGSGQPSDTAALAALGITDSERQQLANTYSPGDSLWRVAITHFTPWDFNWPYAPSKDARRLDPHKASGNDDDKLDNPNCVKRSIIECENQILGESVPVPGTPYSLHYRGDRTPGRKASNTLTIPLTGDTVPDTLTGVELEVSIAGRSFKQEFPPEPSQVATFSWDGKDAYGRKMQGMQHATIHIDYVYDLVLYTSAAEYYQSFSLAGVSPLETYLRRDIRLRETEYVNISPRGGGAWDGRAQGFGGWSLNIQHAYDPNGQVLYFGDGSRRTSQAPYLNLNQIVRAVAGDGSFGFSGDGGSSVDASLAGPDGISVAPDGSIYFADSSNNRVRRVSPDGVISTVAGNGVAGFSGDGGPAVQAKLNHPASVAVTTEGELYISDAFNNRIRFVDVNGEIHTVVGSGIAAPDTSNVTSGCENLNGGTRGSLVGDPDGCLATDFDLFHRPGAVAYANDGDLYFSLPDENRIYRVGAGGIITIFAGTGGYGYNGDDIPARQALLARPQALLVDSDGSIVFSDMENNRVRRVGLDGLIHTVAGTGSAAYSGDGGQAVSAALNYPTGLAVARDGSLYILDSGNFRIRRIEPTGIIGTYAGNDSAATFNNGELAGNTKLDYAGSIALGPDGCLYIPQPSQNRIYQIAQAMHRFDNSDISIPSEDGKEIYEFNAVGRHLRTVNAYTGAIVYEFVYDDDGYLTQIIDGDGNITNITRDAVSHAPIAIIGPDGVQTMLSVDVYGYLDMITYPDGSVIRASYSQDGLLQTFTDARGKISHFQYNGVGQLIHDEDAEGGFWKLEKIDLNRGRRVNLTSSEGYAASYILSGITQLESPLGGQARNLIHMDDTRTRMQSYNDGRKHITVPNGTVVASRISPDPRLGILAPITAEATTTLPSGLSKKITKVRTILPTTDLRIDDTTNINGRLFDSQIDIHSLTITDTTPEGRQIIAAVDDKFRPKSVRLKGIDPVLYNRDTRGRLTGISQADRSVIFSYDASGFLNTVTDSLGRTIIYDHDQTGRVTRQTLPDGRVINIAYDANGNVTSIQPPGREAHIFTYNAVNLEKDYTPPPVSPAGSVTHYSYNLDQQLTSIVRPDGKTVEYNYDGAGRIISVAFQRGQIAYGYNAAGQISSVDSPDNVVLNYDYDGILPVSESWTGQVSGSVARSYNNDFQLIGLAVDGDYIAFNHDADGLLTQAGSLSIVRDTNNGLINGTELDSAATSRTYNSLGELESETASYSGNNLYSEALSRDSLGRIAVKTETVSGITTSYNYSYDLSGRLSSVQTNNVTTAHYNYDTNGNRIGGENIEGLIEASYDAQDRLIDYNGTAYTYTANGELLTKTQAGQTTSYKYDAFGNLTNVTLPGGDSIEYLIDGRDRRVGKSVNGVRVQGFLYQDQLNPIAELDGSGNVVTLFIYGTRANVPDYMVKAGMTYRIISDHLGSPRIVIKVTDGSIAQRLDYDEFGNITQDTNPGFQPFGFAGGIYDSDTGLTRFGARDYDAETGRWTISDPIGLSGGLNLYTFVVNDPINFVDITGLICTSNTFNSTVAGFVGGFVAAFLQGGFNPWVALVGGVIGAIGGYAQSTGVPAIAVGAIAGGLASGGARGGIIGGAASAVLGGDANSSAAGGAAGGFIGGAFKGTVNKYGREIRTVGGNMIRGAGSGFAGGLAQDVTLGVLNRAQDCKCGL